MPPAVPSKVVVLLHSGEYERVHTGLSIAAAAVAAGRPVEVYLFWWALERFLQGRLDEPELGAGREAVETRFEARGMPTLRVLMTHLREAGGCSVYGCTGSLAALVPGAPPERVWGVDGWVGWSAILQRTQGVLERFQL